MLTGCCQTASFSIIEVAAGKVKVGFIYVAPQLPRICRLSGTAFTEPAYSLGHSPGLRSRTLACGLTAVRSPSVPL